ncbi:autotransporter domain-containing protein [Reyranella sp. CPCC 100927]|uniref:autotransporter domain-containing protein n=1 Tax=Reyranella sp. CPCC 100927 TaxID=2599616 RepID=UPI0011B56884|nr:autotransporter domain-containing protein [Reyranella sp. CPCC 100927]TWT04987.1 autotransporter domain-containing protein [Reyranella sp. CPCC 100927]
MASSHPIHTTHQRRFEHRLFKWALLSTLTLPVPAAAQLINWTNPGEGFWQDPANWSSGAVPTSFNSIRMTNGGSAIIDAIAAVANNLDVRSAGTSMITIRNGGTLTSGDSVIGATGGSGAVVVDGAGSRWTIGSNLTIASGASTGTVTVTGPGSQVTAREADVSRGTGNGAINVLDGGAATFTVQFLVGYDAGAVGSATVSGTGSSLVVGQVFRLGNGTGATGRLTVADGGTVTVNAGAGSIVFGAGTARGFINIGAAPGDAAVAPGTLNIAGIAGGGPGSEINFNHTSAAYIFAPQINGGAAVRVFSGTTTLTAANNTYTGGTVLNGGTLGVAADTALGDAAGGLSFDGGTLRVIGTGFTSTPRTITWGAGGGGFDIADPANSFTVSQVLSGTGGLVKQGAGTLVLTGLNTYSGGTTINAGTLQLGNGGPTGSITGNVINNGVLAINRNAGLTLNGVISGSGSLFLTDGSDAILTADNTYTGGTTISNGVDLQLGGGGATGSIIGNVINNGTLAVSRTGTLVLDGVISGTGSLFLGGAGGTTILTAANTYSGGTLIFSGDTLQLGNGGATGSITGAIEIRGTLAINRSDVYIVDNVIVRNGALRQIGTGTTVLTGDNSAFNGTAFVASGTLRVDSKLGTGPVSVQSGGTLGGIGTIGGAVTVADGGTLLGTQGQTLTMGSLTLSGASNINVTLGAPGTTGLFNVTGNLTLDGRLNITDAGGFGPGVYRLIDYSGALTDNGLAIGSVPGGVNAADLLVQTSANQVNLVNRAGVSLNFWDGDAPANPNNNTVDGGNGTWTATNGNWTIPSGASNGPMQPQPGFAIFQGAPGTVTVDNKAGAVAVTGMQFAVNGYRVQGGAITLADPQSIIRVGDGSAAGAEMAATIAAPLAGSGGLVKSDLGTLVLTGANTYTGATTISAGTLRIGAGGSIAASSAVTLSAAGATLDIAAAGNSFVRNLAGVAGTSVVLGGNLIITSTTDTTFAGRFSGGDVLFKDGAATLTLTGANTHTGVTNISGGTLALGPGGSVAMSAGVVILSGATFDITAAGDQTVRALAGSAGATVALGANTLTVNTANSIFSGVITGSGGLVKTGTGAQALDGTNTYTGATTITGGTLLLATTDAIATSRSVTLSASGATLALGSDTTVQNLGGVAGAFVTLGASTLTVTSSKDTIFAGAISGTGGLVKAGAGTLELTGTSTYSGATTLTAGRLTVNGSIASSVVSVTAGTLAGTGTVGGIVATGGTVSPGNSIGTLNVVGNISFAPGSTYEVEIEPAGTSDRLHATGTATLTGGTVSVIKAAGSYTAGTRYTIVTADAGVTGTFSGFTQNLPFINLALAYDPTNVYLDVTRNTVAFCDVAATRNQCATGRGAESLGAGNTLYDIIASLPDTASARQAFDALSGEIHASTRSALIEDSHYLRDAVVARTRLSGTSSTGAAPQFAALAQATDQSQRPQDGTAITAWFQGFGAIARTSGDGNAATAKRTTGGFFVGADTKIAETWTVGLAAGYSRSTLDVDGRSSRATIDSYHLALYGGAQFGPIGLRLGASHTWHSIDSSRSIAFPGFADAARADYKARTTQLFGDVGHALALGDVAVEPFANLAWVHLSTNRFGERGGIAALRARGGSDSNLFSTLGIRAAAQVWNDQNKTLTLRGTLGWRHAFGDVTPAARLAFAGGASFGVEGVPIARNAVVVEAGFDLKVGSSFTVGAGYAGVLASGARDHAFKGNLTYKF